MRKLLTVAPLLACWIALTGCGSDTAANKADPNAAAKSKVEAVKKVADAVSRDPNGDEAFIALEEFRNTSMNPKDYPAESKEIIEIYKSRIEGKLKKGDISDQIRNDFIAFRNQFEKG